MHTRVCTKAYAYFAYILGRLFLSGTVVTCKPCLLGSCHCFQVFVHNGRVHIIPIPTTPGEVTIYPTGTPILGQALQLVFGPHKTEAVLKIQKAIRQRIEM